MVTVPLIAYAVDHPPETPNPVVKAAEPGVPVTANAVAVYPVFSMPPLSPSCTIGMLDPFVLTPSNITVIRCTPAGIPVKLIAVPLVDACAVCDLINAELA
jgi:hypothetical protein